MSDPRVVVPEPKYSVAMIVRNCAEDLEKCLESYGRFPDELVIVNTGVSEDEEGFRETNAVAEKYKAKVYHFPWVDDFAAARNFSFEKCSHDFVMWLDSDDSVENPAKCDENIRRAISQGAEVIFMEYLYEFDRFGNCTTMQKRERVVRKSSFWWPTSAPIHECLCATRQVVPTAMPPNIARIIHRRQREDFERQRASYRRNLKIFREKFEKPGIVPELRMVFYWGNTYFGLGDYQEAVEKYRNYLKRSASEGNGNEPEVISARIGLSEALMILGRMDEALAEISPAVILNPRFPTPYILLAKIAVEKRDWDKAVVYAQQTLEHQKNMDDQLVSNPRELIGRPHWILAMAGAALGRFDVAKDEAEKARKWFNGDPQFRDFIHQVDEAVGQKELLLAWNRVRDQLINEGRRDELAHLSEYAPESLQDEIDVNRYAPKVRPAGKRSIAFVCPTPPALPPWGPWSIKQGIGGSEEATINAAKEFAKRGWHVEVYTNTGRPCREGPVIDEYGVHWFRIETWAGEFDNPLDVAVSWRSPAMFRVSGVNAKAKYLWLHDICNPGAWPAAIEDDFDGFILLSQYHRSLYKFLPEDKIIYSANGMDPDLFVPLDDLKNEPHRMIWGSDPSRGLQYLLPWWGQIREAVPDAELDIYYGWSPLLMLHKGQDRALADIYATVEKHKDQPGVNWHGKVGQDVLAKANANAGVWPYLTSFPEIFAITALKAQAHGVVPVTMDDFALAETVQFGEKLKGKADDTLVQRAFVERVIENLKNPWPREKRLEMARWARSKTWASVVVDWESHFLSRLQAVSTPTLVS